MKETNKENPFVILGILFLLITLGVLGWMQPFHCGDDFYYGFIEYADSYPATQWIELWVNDYKMILDSYANGRSYSVGWLTTEYDTVFTIGDFEGYDITIDGHPIESSGSLSIPVAEIGKDIEIPICFRNSVTGKERTVLLSTLPMDFPVFEMEQYRTDSENFTPLCFTIGKWLVKTDAEGKICYYRGSYLPTEFRQIQGSSGVRYTFLEATGKLVEGDERFPSYKAVVMNEHYQLLDIVETVETADGVVPLTKYGFQYIADRDYILSMVTPQTVFDIPEDIPHNPVGVRLMSVSICRMINGEMQWIWNSVDNVSLYYEMQDSVDLFNKENLFTDYLHLNDMELNSGDGTLLCAFQGLKTILVMDADSGTLLRQISLEDMSGRQVKSIYSTGVDVLCLLSGEMPQAVWINRSEGLEEVDIGCRTACDNGSVSAVAGRYICTWGDTEEKRLLLSVLEQTPDGLRLVEEFIRTNEEVAAVIDRAYPVK